MDNEKLKELKRKHGKKSLQIRLQDSDLYDYNPAASMLLMVICLGQRKNGDAWIQKDCPRSAEEMLGWCDMAQWRLALRSKMSESQVHRTSRSLKKMASLKLRVGRIPTKPS